MCHMENWKQWYCSLKSDSVVLWGYGRRLASMIPPCSNIGCFYCLTMQFFRANFKCNSSRTGKKWSIICLETGLKTNKYKSELISSDLLILQPMAQDVVHVLVEALQAAVTWPHVRVVGGQKTLHRSLQAGQQLPVLLPVRKTGQQEGGVGWTRGKFRNEEGGKEMLVLAVTHVNNFPVIKTEYSAF